MPAIPPSLAPAQVEKMLRTAFGERKPKLDPKALADALKQLEKLDAAVDTSLFERVKLDSAEQAEARLQALESGPLKAAQAAAAQARKAAQLGEKAHAELKNDKAADKKAVGAVGEVAGNARSYATDLLKAAQAAQAELKALLARLLDEEKKGAAKDAKKEAQAANAAKEAKKDEKEDEEADAEAEKDLAAVGARIATALKLAKTSGPTKPMKFMIGVLKKEVFVYVAKATSGSTVTRVKRLMNAGTQSVTIYRGDCVFENKAHTFVGVNIPTGGFAMRIQKSLAELTGKKFKIRVRRPTGETDEAAGDDDDDADDVLVAARERGGAEAAKATAVLDRHKKLEPVLDTLLAAGGPMVAALRAGLRAFDAKVAAKQFDAALKALDHLEHQLVKEALAQQQAQARGEAEIKRQLASLAPQLKQALARGGKAADDLKRKLAQVQSAAKEAARSGVQDAFKLAHRELDGLQKAVEWTLADKSAGERAGDVEKGLRQQAQQVQRAEAEIERRLGAVLGKIGQITDKARRAEMEALLKVIETERKMARSAGDVGRQLEQLKGVLKKVEQATEKVTDTLVALAKRAAESVIDRSKKAAEAVADKAIEEAGAAARKLEEERKRFNKRFSGLVDRVKDLASAGAPDADKLRHAAAEAGRTAKDPEGIERAHRALGALEKKIAETQAALAAKKN